MLGRVFILTAEPPEGGGGAEHLIRELIRGLDARGYQANVLHRLNSAPAWLNAPHGPLVRKIGGSLCGYFIGRKAKEHLSSDVVAVISHSDAGFYPLRGPATMKKIHFVHGTYRAQAEAIRPFISYLGYLYLKWWHSMVLERWSVRGKLVLCNSEQTCEEVAKYFRAQAQTMWLPLDLSRFRPAGRAGCRRRIGLPESGAVGLFAGNVSPMKNFFMVRRMWESLPEVNWVLALRGDVPDDLWKLPKVRVFKNAPPEDLPSLYGAADFAVSPSLYEPFGYVVAEALACGTPVIASPGGASRLFLGESPLDRLLISDPNSVEAFVSAARELLREPQLYRNAVVERVRPKLEGLMAPANWWRRFSEVTGL